MTNRRYLPSTPFAFAAAVLAIVIMAGCTQTQQTQPAPAVATPPPGEKVFITFEGPWAFAPDPKDANFVIAMAPKTTHHRDLFVKASYFQTLASGVYELSMPPRTAAPAGTFSPDILQAKIDPKDVQRVLDTKLERYAIRLPKPEAYTPAGRYTSRVGSVYPPDPGTVQAKPWATAVSLQYSVGSLSTFELKGTPDTGTFQPLTLQVDIPHIRFEIHPAHADDPSDKCYSHDRQTFHDLTKLLGLTLYVDYPDSPTNCHDKDPQKGTPAKAQLAWPSLLVPTTAFPVASSAEVQEADVVPTRWLNWLASGAIKSTARNLTAAFYFFALPDSDCKSPIVGGG